MPELHDTEGFLPAADRPANGGGVSSAEGKRKERRSETIDAAPSFGAALADGQIGAGHVDALADASAKLDAEVRERLFGYEEELLTEAASMSPEPFGRSVRERARANQIFGAVDHEVAAMVAEGERRHDHVIHDHGLVLRLEPDRTLHLARPDGSPVCTSEPDVPPQRTHRSRRRRAAA